MILEDIPIFYLVSKNHIAVENYWAFTGRSRNPPVNPDLHCHRVYFTTELILEISSRVIPHSGPHAPNNGGAWDLIPPEVGYVSRNGWDNWIVKHRSGYVWKLHYARDNRVNGYALGVWPD